VGTGRCGRKPAQSGVKPAWPGADHSEVGATSAAISRTIRALPHGQALTPEVWERRHRGIVLLLWLHGPALAAFGISMGVSAQHSLAEGTIIALLAILAGQAGGSRRMRASVAVLGLVTSSAVLVHLSGGIVEAHFHFFVVIGIIALYQDWLPFGLSLAYVVLHHGVLGVVYPQGVFNHGAAIANPWRWAIIHGVFVLAASITHLVNWRLTEQQATEISRLVSRLEGLARTDALTGIPNRRVWDEELPRELVRARRTGTPLCVAMIDLDHFKDFNDAHGHQAGDLALKEAVAAWRGQLRASDLLARYGGEEFALLLPDCQLSDATMVVDRLRSATPGPTTCSIGVVSWDFQEGPADLVGRADRALYTAKAGGRNRYVAG
jgi:diguanylate cyclase (GGDEF)-like protein